MKRKIKLKLNKEQKSFLIALLIGDGTISSNYVFKLSHCIQQKEYLIWKITRLNELNIKNNGIKKYISNNGYNIGKTVFYSQLSVIPTIKALRKTVYVPKKTITRKLLNWLTEEGIAIWFMDDGCMNINNSTQRASVQHTIKISTCVNLETAEIIIKYFKEKWNINFRLFKEGSNSYSIATRCEEDCENFIRIVKPYILPIFSYKIRKNLTKEEFIKQSSEGRDISNLLY